MTEKKLILCTGIDLDSAEYDVNHNLVGEHKHQLANEPGNVKLATRVELAEIIRSLSDRHSPADDGFLVDDLVDQIEADDGPEPAECNEVLYPGARIFYPDDTESVTKMVRRIVGRTYTDLRIFPDGQEAWEEILAATKNDNPPHLVLSDMEMPKLDGIGLHTKIDEKNRAYRSAAISIF